MSGNSLVGSVIAGRFRVVEQLGEGSMGEVYVAEHTVLNRKLAIKVLKTEVETEPRLVERFRREARAASRLDHPNIVYIADFGQTEDGRLYLAMEYTPGRDLYEEMERFLPGHMPLDRALKLVIQIAQALESAHNAGVVHRDLKPENMLLIEDRAGGERVKILDFGMAKILGDSEDYQLTRQGEVFGSPAYMSPEQITSGPPDPRMDLYSLGVLTFEICTGRLPFLHQNITRMLIAHQQELPPSPSSVLPEGEPPLPPELEALILRCMEKDPARRPASATEVLAGLRSSLEALQDKSPASAFVSVASLASVQFEEMDFDEPTLIRKDAIAPEVDPTLAPPKDVEVRRLGLDANQTWEWDRICKKAKRLATELRDHRLGSASLTTLLGTLQDLDEQVMALETEIALLIAKQEDLDNLTRERESRLRYAVVDLSVERGRMLDEPNSDDTVLADLDYQIQVLETRIADVFKDREAQLERVQQEREALEQRLVAAKEHQGDAETRLLRTLHEVRPAQCPAELDQQYRSLDAALNKFHLTLSA